jgi:cell division septal protein FtsQ
MLHCGFSADRVVRASASTKERWPKVETRHGVIKAVLIAWTLAVIGVAMIGAVAAFLLG